MVVRASLDESERCIRDKRDESDQGIGEKGRKESPREVENTCVIERIRENHTSCNSTRVRGSGITFIIVLKFKNPSID